MQPALPSPTTIPENWPLIIIDLKDLFSTAHYMVLIVKFVFTIPSINKRKPALYQCKVLPQGMLNSPTICQTFMGQATAPVRQKYPEAYTTHYRADTLFATQDVS